MEASSAAARPIDRRRQIILTLAAVFAGIGFPAVAFSKGVMAAVAAISFVCAAIVVLHHVDRRAVFADLKHPFSISIMVMFGAWLIAALAGIAPERSLTMWGASAGVVLCAWMLNTALRVDERALVAALRALIAASVIVVVIAVIAVYVWHGAIDPFGNRGVDGLHNARQKLKSFGPVLPCLAPVVLWAGFRLGGRWRIAGFVFLVLAAAIVPRVASKDGMLGAGLVILVPALAIVFVRLPRPWRMVYAGTVIAVTLAAALTIVAYLPKPPVRGLADFRISKQIIDVHRQAIWGFAVDWAWRSPVIGHGPDASRNLPGANRRVGWFAAEYVPAHNHNWILQAWVESGFLGLAAMLVAVIMLFLRFLRGAARGAGAGWAGVGLMAAFFGSWLVNFSLWAIWWQLGFLLLVAIVASDPRLAGKQRLAPQPRSGHEFPSTRLPQ